MMGCRYCESQAPLETCPERGEVICTDCGAVCNENNIVTEVSFDKESGGPLVFGQLLYADGLSSYERRKVSKSTVGQAKKRLLCLGAKLRLSSSCIETGFSFYKLAISQGLLRGFRNNVADAVLLYITCRLEGTPHMLMDFSDILRINLFTLGRLFLKLSKELHLSLPLADPWQYILRFSSKLSLGEKRQEVARTALRLVARMKRDWMSAGRHPCGLYGAALFVSARLSGFSVNIREIARIVSLHSTTIRKRLLEFESTPSCALTIDEFFRVDLSGEEEPPAFKRARKPSREESDSDSEEDSLTDSSLGVRGPQLSVDETIAKARYLQKLREASPLSQAPVSQNDLERFSFLDSVETPTKIASEDELDTTGLDETEIEDYILSVEEVEMKTELWTSEFGEFEEERLLRAERRKKLDRGRPVASKKRRTLEVEVGPESSTREALQQVIIKTGLQSRLNIGTLLGDPVKEGLEEKEVQLDGCKISSNGYESGDSDSAKPDSPLGESLYKGEDVAAEQDMYFEDYDIR